MLFEKFGSFRALQKTQQFQRRKARSVPDNKPQRLQDKQGRSSSKEQPSNLYPEENEVPF